MKVYVGVTDSDWVTLLAAKGAEEVNFWQPSGGRQFKAIETGEPFLFKTHYSDNRIVGGGFLSGWSSLPVSEAWSIFGESNGCISEDDMRKRVMQYRRAKGLQGEPQVGCIMLRDVRFFGESASLPAPSDWSPSIVQGKTYEITSQTQGSVESAVSLLLNATTVANLEPETPGAVFGPVFGPPQLSKTRVGQKAFRALVSEAYGRRCAVTGTAITPVLQAAHIQPVSKGGENRVDNGILLRSDVHTLFDLGYLGVDPLSRKLRISPYLEAMVDGAAEYLAMAKADVSVAEPKRKVDRPHSDFFQWHYECVFKKSVE